MAKADHFAAALQRNFDGQPWHGSSLLRGRPSWSAFAAFAALLDAVRETGDDAWTRNTPRRSHFWAG